MDRCHGFRHLDLDCLARALTLNGQAAEAMSELAVIEQAVRDYGSVGCTAALCALLGEVHAALGDTAEAHAAAAKPSTIKHRRRTRC